MVHLRPRVLNLKTSLRLAELTHRFVIAVLIIKGQRFCEEGSEHSILHKHLRLGELPCLIY